MYKTIKIHVCKKIRRQEICLKLVPNGQSDKAFLLTSSLCPEETSVPAAGLNTCIKQKTKTKKNV